METLKAGFLYFLSVFAAGFVLGAVRVLWIAPQVGTRVAEMIEVPVMLVVIIVAARWIVRRFRHPPSIPRRVAAGLIALGLILVTEVTVVLRLQGWTIEHYIANRDPVAGTIYVAMLVVFALVPVVVARKTNGTSGARAGAAER
jgi:uncharacterized membrane protein